MIERLLNMIEKLLNWFTKARIRVRLWLIEQEPVICYACKRPVRKKDVTYEETTFGLTVPLCHSCHIGIFGLWGR